MRFPCGTHDHGHHETHTIEPSELSRARQVGELLALQHHLGKQPQRQGLIDGIADVIDDKDGGRSATFAARVGTFPIFSFCRLH